jgi:diacylglycerol kinase (ATP)
MWIVAVNPHSGNGRGRERAELVFSILDGHDAEYIKVEGSSPQDFMRQLNNILDSGTYQGVFSVGGDGLAHMVFQSCIPRKVPFAIIPAGTGNDFVRSLGWSLENNHHFIRQVLTTAPRAIDMGLVDSEWFGAILSTGFDSIVNERANALSWPKGPSRYNVAIALELPQFTPRTYTITADSHTFTTEAMLIAIGNGKSYGGGMNVCPQAQLNDGLFDLVILEPVSKFEFLRTFPKVYSGSHISHPQVRTMRAQKVSLHADAVAYADGERIGPAPITAECVQGAGLTWVL